MNYTLDLHAMVEWSIKAQIEVIRASAILANARIDRHTNYLAGRH